MLLAKSLIGIAWTVWISLAISPTIKKKPTKLRQETMETSTIMHTSCKIRLKGPYSFEFRPSFLFLVIHQGEQIKEELLVAKVDRERHARRAAGDGRE